MYQFENDFGEMSAFRDVVTTFEAQVTSSRESSFLMYFFGGGEYMERDRRLVVDLM